MTGSTLKLSQTSDMTSENVNFDGQAISATITAGQTQNVDLAMTDDVFITGGRLRTNGAAFGDTATFQVVDKNNITGLGANTVLGQYVTDWVMKSDSNSEQDQCSMDLPYPAKILGGLFLRIIYKSTGSNPVQVAMNYDLHKALY